MKRVWTMIVLSIFLIGCGGGDDLETRVTGTGLETTGTVSGEDQVDVAAVESEEDSCVVGSWKMTNFSEYLQAMVAKATEGMPLGGELTSTDSGDLIISFDGETMSMSENDFKVTASMLGVTVPVDIEASGSVPYEIADGRIINSGQGEVDADANSGGLSYSVDLTNWAARAVDYECEGDSLTWKAGDNFEVDLTFVRS